MKKLLLGKVLPVIIVLAVGVFVARALIASRPQPKKKQKIVHAPLVQVIEAQPQIERINVVGMGTVIPARELQISSEVGGRIIKINSKLEPGGYIKKGEFIAKIDSRNYRSAVTQRKAQLKEAETNLKIEEGRQEIARREWELMNESLGVSESSSDLALRKPQLENAQAGINSAKSFLYKARLDLGRAVTKAPFNVTVQKKSVEIGQIVTPQTPMATLVGADEYWVQVNIQVGHISLFDLPDSKGKGGAKAVIIHNLGETEVKREGNVIRLMNDIETSGRMARLLVLVDDPLGLKSEEKSLPLLINAYVRVEIEGHEIDGVFVVPRTAVREGDRIWIIDESNKLEVREVDIVWRRAEDVFIKDGISAGERIITNRLPTPIPGMALRVQNELVEPEVAESPEVPDQPEETEATEK